VAVPGWAAEEYGHLVGRQAVGVVADRMPPGYDGALDAWPALAESLMGEDWRRVGTVEVEYWECDHRFPGSFADKISATAVPAPAEG